MAYLTPYKDSAASSSSGRTFDPTVHLAYRKPDERLSMSDMGLDHVGAPSPIGVTSPFALASLEGVKALRSDILQPNVIDHYMTPSAISGSHGQLRGMAPHAARFVHDFWTSPAVLAAVSEAAGEDLVPVFDYELGHTNIQVPAGLDRREYTYSLSHDPYDKSAPPIDAPKPDQAAAPVVGYHRDAYPWVCVLMLSDVSNMIGGETEIQRGDGSKLRAIGPSIGSCVMMQGGYIEHCALPCHGARERITMVTSFRPRGKIVRDMSDLTTIRSCSNTFEVYDQFVHSRITVLQEALQLYRQRLEARRSTIEGTFGRRGGLQRPTVDLPELEAIATVLRDTLSNAVAQMPPYGSDPMDVYTPRPDDATMPAKL